MNIPAYTSPTLRIGRTYDSANSQAGIDIYPPNIPTTKENVNQFKFDYRVIKNSIDVTKLLDISGELSLKVKAGLVNVEGSGKYLNDSRRKENTTEVLAVLKCITVCKTMDGQLEVAKEVASGKKKQGLGTHYVRGVIYGAELVASLSIKESSASERLNIQGSASGQVNAGAVDASLKAQLQSLAAQCSDLSDIAITYYATELPDKLPTTLNDLITLIEQFPSRLEKINNGQGIPLQFELLPIYTAIQTVETPFQHKLSNFNAERLEQRFDDLRSAQTLVDKYENSREQDDDDDDDDVLNFCEQITKVMSQFIDAINLMNAKDGEDRIDNCLKTYQNALDGRMLPGKFCRQWKKILKGKKPTTDIKEIDKMSGGNPFVQKELTENTIHGLVADALDEGGDGIDIDTLKELLMGYDLQLKDSRLSDKERNDIQKRREDVIGKINAFHKSVQNVKDQIEETSGGCYPGSAVFVDVLGRRRQMESLQVGEKVQVVTKNEIRSEPVITFIHCQPEVMQEFLKITTLKKKILKITEDHLLFIEKEGQALAIPAREVNIGDTVYVRGDQDEVEKDAVQSIRPVFEKGVYAPVTLSGTLLVNDVHTSCYFDVLSHEWSHRAMGVARAVYHVSPWMVQWISNIGQEDGFPGWCRLAHKMLTFMD